ncbi:ribonucleotide monophosphatase NagD (HAD superfamily) [Arcanobacterium hippocoleae]|uniref:Ribonucleotide monophosphatase NagD (HAD superfamily) n=2 Tax=Arcanobacterium hippocoleae TaxID=149017 RepID=A0ABU1T3B4_9ACTO|nr:HAD hydrolase-like protein [Arcanobacterium hippocoleae]MDR6939877.1 ribonucleotide monophosphatase NagD (HAD superfamily) [Arcanobacterium hippocoleae]
MKKETVKEALSGLKDLRLTKKIVGRVGKVPEIPDDDFEHPNLKELAVMVEGAPQQLFAGYLINLDSSVRDDNFLLPELDRLLNSLKSVRRQAYFVANDCYLHPQDFVERLARHGLEVPVENVFTPVRIAQLYLRREFAGAKVLSLADERFNKALRNAGINLVADPLKAEVVLLSHNLNFNFELFTQGYQALAASADTKLVTLSMMRTRKMGADGQVVPGTRGYVRALESATRTSYYENLGRPGVKYLEVIFAESGLDPADTLFVSDSLSNDIRPTKRFGLPTALLLTGSSTLAQAKSAKQKDQPNYLVDSVAELVPAYIMDQVEHPAEYAAEE